MKDTLIIDGRIYISSRRAAEMSKYSNDYIGQLCRGGKVAAKMMGRVWFVEKDSLFGHKKAAEDVLSGKTEKTTPIYKNTRIAASAEEFAARKTTATHTRKSSFSGRRVVMASVTAIVLVAGGLVVANTGIFASKAANAQTASVAGFIGWVEGIFGHHDTAIAENQSNVPADQTPSVNIPSWNGMVVAPSDSSNDNTKQQIQSSFSDNVTITPDATGNAGVIKPVFKKSNGDDFVYVLVPVKDGKTASSSTKLN